MRLSPAMNRYIVHWGEMGQRWNVNRTVAQIHALLYLAEAPMAADEIVETLGVARSNVSTSIKELLGWDLVRLVHIPGDRRDHFEARQDPWDMLMTIVEGRKRREIDPTLAILRECVAAADADGETPPAVREKLRRMLDLTQKLSAWYEQIRNVPRPVLMKLLGLGAKITALVGR
ncbi:GbsR/MarR family transcriptional regulator [Caulobacter sp. KR2-114]|uniref:GbsR/MarR family transcriptional regulator n=1 Tax=Caulobacter sp. KR2-114 TaxID=3400912 RepID=UPI003BFC73F5